VTINADGTYHYVPAANYNGTDSFTYRITDGVASSVYTVTINVSAVNDAPVGNNLSIAVDEDGSVAGQLPVAVDADGDTLTYLLQSGASHGVATVLGDGSYNYAPAANFSGTDSFTYAVFDGTVTSVYTVTVTVGAENDAPTGSDLAISVSEDASYSGSLPLASDADGDTILYGLGTPAAYGAVTVNPDGTFSYVPQPNFSGPDQFTYTLYDGTETVSYTVTINVQAVNDAPVGSDTAISVAEDNTFSGQLPPSVDADNQPVTYGLAAAANHGTVTVNADGTFSYTPDSNYNGTDSFSYSVTDGTATNVYRVSVTISAINDAPVGSDTSISVLQGTVSTGNLPPAFDVEGSAITYGLGAQAANGTVSIGPNGAYSYQPNPGFAGNDQFTYTLSDGTAVSVYTVTVSVGANNSAPTAQDATLTVAEDTPFTGSLPVATDADGDAVTYSLAADAAHGVVTVTADGRYSYIADRNYNGADQFSYSVSDGRATVIYRVFINVTPVNDAPVGSDAAISLAEDTTFTGQLPPASDADGNALVYGLAAAAGHGTVTIDASGAFSYTPDSNYNGTDSFSYSVSDGIATHVYRVTVSIAAVNDAPVGADTSISVEEGNFATGNLPPAVDPEGTAVTYGLGAQAAHGTVTVGVNGTYTYQPDANFRGSDRFTYTVSDGSATSVYTVTVSVGAANGAPVGNDTTLTLAEDTPTSGRLPVATDPDGDALAYGLAGSPAHGVVTITADGRYTFTPDRNFNGTDQFSYSVSDGRAMVVYRVFVTVTPVNDAPVGSGTAIAVGQDQTATGSLPPAFDVEGSPVAYGIGTGAAHGTVNINPNGSYTYTPAAGYQGSDSFTYTVSDGQASSTYTVAITVGSAGPTDPVEKPPAGERPPLERDAPVQFPLEANDPGAPRVDDAQNLGSGMDKVLENLGAISDDITVDGAVGDAVNAIRDLNGIGSLRRDGAVLHAVRQIADWIESGRRLDDLHIGFFKGGSNIHLAGSGGDDTWFTVDTIFNEDYLYIMPTSTGDVEDANFSVTMADGRALPDWMTLTHGGMIIGRPPVGTVSIDIRIWGTSSEGTISDTIRIDLQTGTIIDHVRDRRADLGPGTLFSTQMLAEAHIGRPAGDKLWAALQGR
jgi:VCBS repeat-containing protein